MKFNRINYSDLIHNMKRFEIDLFDYAKHIITASEEGKGSLASMYCNEATGYINALRANDLISSEEFFQLSDYINHNYLDWSERN